MLRAPATVYCGCHVKLAITAANCSLSLLLLLEARYYLKLTATWSCYLNLAAT